MTLFQLAQLTSYDFNATIAILGVSTGNTVSLFLRALLSLLPLGVIAGIMACVGVVILAGSVDSWAGAHAAIKRVRRRFGPYGVLSILPMVLIVFVVPWPYVGLIVFSTVVMIILGVLNILASRLVAWLKARNVSQVHARQAEVDASRGGQLWAVVGVCLFLVVWLLQPSTWIPYERFEPKTGLRFTGQVVGTDADQLIVVTTDRRPRVLRLPMDTVRSFCMARLMHYHGIQASTSSAPADSAYSRSIAQLALDVPDDRLPLCPEQTSP
jgi:hypothetical protein